jgi:hypothetical protein
MRTNELTGRRTDRYDGANSHFRNFAKATKRQESVMGWIKLHDKKSQNLHNVTDVTLIWVVVRPWKLKWAEQCARAGKMTK